jgi:hypothetical protein
MDVAVEGLLLLPVMLRMVLLCNLPLTDLLLLLLQESTARAAAATMAALRLSLEATGRK